MPDTPASRRLAACHDRIYALVRAIPPGKVMTYGQIAALAAVDCSAVPAVTVGRAMAASGREAPDLPWWRVIGRAGKHGILRKRSLALVQRDLLLAEGVTPDAEGRYDLGAHSYKRTPSGDRPPA